MDFRLFPNKSKNFEEFLNDNDFVSRKLDKKLLSDILNLYTRTSESEFTVPEFNNIKVRYFGDFLSNIESYIDLSDTKTLFTAIFAVLCLINAKNIVTVYINEENEIYRFTNAIYKRLETNFDIMSAVLLFSDVSCKDYRSSLYKKIEMSVLSSKDSFEIIFALYTLLRYSGWEENFIDFSNYEEVLLYALKNIDNLTINKKAVGALALFYDLLDSPKTSEFKNKSLGHFLYSARNLGIKEVTPSDIKAICSLVNTNEGEIHYFNYYFTNIEKINFFSSRMNRNSIIRTISNSYAYYFRKADNIPTFVIDALRNKITDEMTFNNKKTYTFKERDIIIDLVSLLTECASSENLIGLIDFIEDFDVRFSSAFSISKHLYMLLNEDLYKVILNSESMTDVFMHVLFRVLTSNEDEKYKDLVLKLAKDSNYDVYTFANKRYNHLIINGVMDIYDYKKISKSRNAVNFLTYLKSEMSAEEYTKYIVAFINETVINSDSSLTQFYLKDMKSIPWEIDDKNLLKQYILTAEDLYFTYNIFAYPEFMYLNITNDKYKEIMDISDKEENEILKFLYTSDFLSKKQKDIIAEKILNEVEFIKREKSIFISNVKSTSFYGLESLIVNAKFDFDDEIVNEIKNKMKSSESIYRDKVLDTLVRLISMNKINKDQLYDLMISLKED